MIHVASTYVADVLNDSLTHILQKFSDQGIAFHYNQVIQQALFPNSEFNENRSGLNVVLLRTVDLIHQLDDLQQALMQLQRSAHVPLLVLITPSKAKTVEETNQYLQWEYQLKMTLGADNNTLFVSSEEIQQIHNDSLIFDEFTEKHGHIPYTVDFYDSVAMIIARKYSLLTRKPFKVIVLDCDGTLWRGVVEEDGLDGIVIDEEFQAIQKLMITFFEAGFLLCLCSKNSETSVLEVLKLHKDMLFDLDKHICSHKINWQPKSENIKALAEELDLGLDSFIFIDDNVVECAEVKSALPEVLVIELPNIDTSLEGTLSRIQYLKTIWAFDTHNRTSEDGKRTEYYKQNKFREALKSESVGYEQFLKNLQIQTCVREANATDLERIIQLSLRTNQFNLAPRTIFASEFNHRILSQQPSGCLVIEAADKYGDYGLVGAVVYDVLSEELVIKNFFLSCRILGRGIEFSVIKHLLKLAKQHSAKAIKFLFKVTDRNIPGIGFIQYISHQDKLENLEHVLIKLDSLEHLTPKLIRHAVKQDKTTSSSTTSSNEYLLEIAQHYLSKKQLKSEAQREFATVEISLVELFKQHHLWVEQNNIALIDLGITSLQSVLLASTIYQRFHVEILPFELLKPSFTFQKLTQYVLKQLKENHVVAIESNEMDATVLPLSSTQLRLWEDEQIFQGTYRNNMFSAYEIEGEVHPQLLEQALIQLMENHDALRFSFFVERERPSLKLNDLASIPFKLDIFASEKNSEIEQFVKQFKQKPFALDQAPLFRAALIKTANKSIFLFSIHHLIHDGWSLNLLLLELSKLYQAYTKHVSIIKSPETKSYLNFIKWQHNMISEDVLDKQRAFWKKYLFHMPKLELIYDKTRKDMQDKPLNQRLTFKIHAKNTRKLKQMALDHHVTLYDVLLTVFGIFLTHYTNQEDINFVTAVSGRHHSCVAKVIGFFTNLVLIRLKFNQQDSVSEFFRKSQKVIHSIFDNQDLPFNEIIQLTGESVNSKLHAFNQAGFIFQSYPINHLIINNKACKRVYADDMAELAYDSCDECRFGNLVFFMQEYDSELHAMIEYNKLLFEEPTIRCMMDAFKALISQVVDAPEQPALSIPLLPAKQYKQLFHQWNQPIIHYPNNYNLLHCFLEQVSAQKNAIAVIHNDQQLTYGELDKMTNQVARALRKTGVTKEAPVGIFLEKSHYQVIAMLSIIKAGGCYVPLDIDLPVDRMNFILKDAGVGIVLTQDQTDKYLQQHCPAIKTLSITGSNIQTESTAAIHYATNPKRLAYILYTSGSTGNPKGVAIEQRGILRLVKSPNYIKINQDDRIAQVSSFLFDAATFEIWGALLNGATLVLIDKKVLLDGEQLDKVMTDKKISIMFLTTQLFHAYIQLVPHLFQNLNYLLVGGEAMLPETVERLFSQKHKPRFFVNMYGPTENTTYSTSYIIKKNVDLSKPIPIGRPISGTQVYVLDELLNPQPIGAPGTLYVGGTGLGRGYVNQQLNQDKYIYYGKERLYNSGDMVVWQPDGQLKFLGRKDNQIKINGYRIELDEIALQLETHHLVVQAIVLLKTQNYHRHLVSYILLEPGYDLKDVNLYHYLKTILPHYMLPKLYYQIDKVPVTVNGKVDKKLLLKSDFAAISYTLYEPATNNLQQQLISIYAEVLHMDSKDISINAEFFDLGGTSITALHFIDKVNEQFKVKINFSTLYEYANVKSLSAQIGHLISKGANYLLLDSLACKDKALKIINEGDAQKAPLIFIHPIGGTGFCYLDLIKQLPHSQPCYIIQDPSIDANQILFDDMPAMADCYNQLLLKHFKCRKIILGGYSFGGMLSLEMVSQLESRNLDKNIDSIVAFDTWVVSDFLNVEAKEALKLSILRQYERVATNLINEHIDPKPWMELYYRRLQDLGFAYKPPKINKKIILFKANQQSGEFSAMKDLTNYLNGHTTKGVDVHIVSGNHDTILQYPNVRKVGRLLSHYMKGKTH